MVCKKCDANYDKALQFTSGSPIGYISIYLSVGGLSISYWRIFHERTLFLSFFYFSDILFFVKLSDAVLFLVLVFETLFFKFTFILLFKYLL